MKFYELALGARFVFRGHRFVKIAMCLAEDQRRWGNIFLGDTDVVPDGVPVRLSPAEAARWKPADKDWADYLTPAPGQPASSPSDSHFQPTRHAPRNTQQPTSSPSAAHTQPGASPNPG